MKRDRLDERTLLGMWSDRFFDRTPLQTTDGDAVVILDQGKINTDAGPDVTGAVVRIGSRLVHGDVEFHTNASLWYSHGHGNDPKYNGTVLHMVLHARPGDHVAVTSSGRTVPLIVVDPPQTGRTTELFRLRCHGIQAALPDHIVPEWLRTLSVVRAEEKVHRLQNRLLQINTEEHGMTSRPLVSGTPSPEPPAEDEPIASSLPLAVWEQLLYEGLMEASGYSVNIEPFLRLARNCRLSFLRRFGLGDICSIAALLFGIAGFLERTRGSVLSPSLGLRWRTLRSAYVGEVLSREDWQFFRLRPANVPTSRLAGVCLLLPHWFAPRAFAGFLRLFQSDRLTYPDVNSVLEQRLNPGKEAIHFRMTSLMNRGMSSPVTPGRARRSDMIVNVILPAMLLYARLSSDQTMHRRVLDFSSSLGSLQNNTITRRMEADLPGHPRLRSAQTQQGALHLYTRYCRSGRCGECAIGQELNLESVDFAGNSDYPTVSDRRNT